MQDHVPEVLRPDATPQAARLERCLQRLSEEQKVAFEVGRAPSSNAEISLFEEAWRTLTTEVRNSTRLTAVGRLLFFRGGVGPYPGLLEARQNAADLAALLRTSSDLKTRAAEKQELSPIVITGLARTGTTLLQRALSDVNPHLRVLCGSEANYPFAESHVASRNFHRSQHRWKQLAASSAAFGRTHVWSVDAPQECTPLLMATFCNRVWGRYADLPEYRAWLAARTEADLDVVYRAYGATLDHLTRVDRRRLLLKAPSHLWNLEALLRAIPNAQVLIATRRLSDCLASYCTQTGLLRAAFERSVDPLAIGREARQEFASGIQASRAAMTAYPLSVHGVSYRELTDAPVRTMEQVHAWIGEPWTGHVADEYGRWFRQDEVRHAERQEPLALSAFGLDRQDVDMDDNLS